ncbi:sensor histidine kinase [Massilia yuzhufengensis]|uniref:Histidine kinase-, DNA gyrase B-, and HSP90-like ATPase n=1 Tax=Massilia yuzhufengensis TaxID=1164594 RepID=A0A1I1WFT8_9BURK|nr:ATP-binding protein [Massilia yuzhufengensis]SFD92263.1 Histidine kinase-, DNA gyrase B-, and HSP90-like ATPase [Massilia yuzhufengensis]
MSFQAHAHRIPEGSSERERLDHTLDLAGRLLVEGRDSILDLRAAGAPGELALALREFGAELAQYCAHGFEMHIEGKPQRLAGQVADEIYAIGREALFNASRYAQASTTSLELDYGRAAFTLRVRDDGCGLDAAVARDGQRPGHWGLVGMRERAAAIGARLAIASRPGQGTTIEVVVPAARAYQASLCGVWQRLIRTAGGRGRRGQGPVRH